MIVVTVGTQLPFDRLIEMVDNLAPALSTEVFAQTGESNYKPKHISWSPTVSARDFDRKLEAASVIVSHAGIGTVLKAYKFQKPIILVPRRAAFGEHRNDHQLATVKQLRQRPGIYVAERPDELSELLSSSLSAPFVQPGGPPGRLRLQSFIATKLQTVLR